MALFSRRKKKTSADPAPAEDATTSAPAADDESSRDQSPSTADGAAEHHSPGREEPGHLHGGPYDEVDAPDEERVDLGGIRIPPVHGMELRMEMDKRTQGVVGANLVLDGSSLQIQAFAAPKSRGLWKEVRTSLRDSVVSQGGTAETREGPFGTELVARLPIKRADGRTGHRPARFLGVDGPRWFLRAVLSGPALGDKEAAQRFETILSGVVVVRGSDAMAPQELIPLRLPGKSAGPLPAEQNPLNPLERGPEITQIG
ncbi:MAG: DUF3710 domain-containing protein [Brachybacterium sp.]|nr:DUF3710 domain-containing protein [Brachybacterium sp.]